MKQKYHKPNCEIVVLNLSSLCYCAMEEGIGLAASTAINQGDAEAKQNTFVNSDEDLPSYNAWDTWED